MAKKIWDEAAARHKGYYNKIQEKASDDYDRSADAFDSPKKYEAYQKRKEKASPKKRSERVEDTYE